MVTISNENNYCVEWISKTTNNEGRSQKPMSYESARDWSEYANKKYPHVTHSIAEFYK